MSNKDTELDAKIAYLINKSDGLGIKMLINKEVRKARVDEIERFVLNDFINQVELLKDKNPFYKQLKTQSKYLRERLVKLRKQKGE